MNSRLSLSKEKLVTTCKIGEGKDCCRYIVCGSEGFYCAKNTSLKEALDSNMGHMTAMACNCEGLL